MGEQTRIFDDVGGFFQARLREYRLVTRTSRIGGSEVSLKSHLVRLDVKFNQFVLDKLHEPCFIAIERPTSDGGRTYLIYEATALKAEHYQMLGMEVSLPIPVRQEFLDRVREGWGTDETWIDVEAVFTGYRMDICDGIPVFRRSNLTPLPGFEAKLLSAEALRYMLCVEGGADIGRLIGFDIPLTIDIESLIKYHAGVFGFTGCGKSNLTSLIIRKAIERIPDLSVVIFDVAGEYAIYLLDVLLTSTGYIVSSEHYKSYQSILDSQAIPESLEESIGYKPLENGLNLMAESGRILHIQTSSYMEYTGITLHDLFEYLEERAVKTETSSLQVRYALKKLSDFLLRVRKLTETDLKELRVTDLGPEVKAFVEHTLTELARSVHEKSGVRTMVEFLLGELRNPSEEEFEILTPQILVEEALKPDFKLSVVYIPDSLSARRAVTLFLDRLLLVKKTIGVKRKVLVVLDEAQEYIPDRANREDGTMDSNRSVEALLRQGRKYRVYGWIASQRLAHMNVNALQQLHSYFVSTLPRYYDRMVVADAFSLSYELLDKVTELDTGEWLFVSFKATKQRNVPSFIKAYNNEDILVENLRKLNLTSK
ncbi:MAG: DUF87 domain-containing protein [Candidatus Bathyarchaeia archaeon]